MAIVSQSLSMNTVLVDPTNYNNVGLYARQSHVFCIYEDHGIEFQGMVSHCCREFLNIVFHMKECMRSDHINSCFVKSMNNKYI